MADELLKAWIRQANADLQAGRAERSIECHRRYWLQQAYEKGIKALGMMLWRGPPAEDGLLRAHFLHSHSPLRRLKDDILANPTLPQSLQRLRRQIETELNALDGDGLLRKVDGTTPTTDHTGVSYRYPFQDAATGEDIAPMDWTTAEWDAYQGNATGVIAAIERFLKAVENCRRRGARSAS
jgi:hypothetical protein